MSTLRSVLRGSAWALSLTVLCPAGAYAAETVGPSAPPPRQESALQPTQQPGTSQGMTMMCPMMAEMGMSGMNMSGMGMAGMNTSGLGTNHGTGTTTTLTDLAQNVSMRDITQMLQDMVAIQERMLAAIPQKQAIGIRRDLDRVKERSRELLTEIRGMISAAAKGE